MRLNEIKIKLIILIFITLIPLSLLKFIEIRNRFNESMELELKASEELAIMIDIQFSNYIEGIWKNNELIGKSIRLNTSWDEDSIRKYLNNMKSENEAIVDYIWLSNNGTVISDTRGTMAGKNISDLDYVKEILLGKEKVIFNLTIDINDERMVVPVSRGIIDDNELKGIIVGLIDVEKLELKFYNTRIGETSSYGIIDKGGIIVFRSGSRGLPLEKRKIKDDSPAWKALNGEIVKTKAYKASIDGSTRMGVNYPIKSINWSCFVTTSADELLALHKSNAFNEILLFMVIYILSFSIAIKFSNKMTSSIDKLIKVSNDVTCGNLNVKTNFKDNDSLAEVGQTFDKMIEAFRQKMTEVEEYNSLKVQFLSTMSHELRTPLNIILGCIQVMELTIEQSTSSVSSSLNKYMRMQKQNCRRLLRLVNNIIDINKADVNNLNIEAINTDIIQLVENITMSIVEYGKLKDIDIVFDTEVEEKVMVIDPDMIEKSILNLLSNALKFTEKGGVIEVNIYDKEESLSISIRDSGIGIPEDKVHIIFDRFAQVDNTLSRRTEGSGIGLSLVKHIVELHGGKISVNSEIRKGSEFIIELPVTTLEINKKAVAREEWLPNIERIQVEFSDIYPSSGNF
jgi:signal transduction histidine kinase